MTSEVFYVYYLKLQILLIFSWMKRNLLSFYPISDTSLESKLHLQLEKTLLELQSLGSSVCVSFYS